MFHFFLPLAAQAGTEVVCPDPLPVTSLPTGIGLLLVDDDELVRNAARRMLEKGGGKVFAATGGEEAIEIYRRHQKDISVVIVDSNMPDMSGLETFVGLQQINPDVVGIVATGFTRTKIKTEALGLSGFVQKPFTMAQLSQAIAEALSGRTPPR